MKARRVFENIDFKRGISSKEALGIGIWSEPIKNRDKIEALEDIYFIPSDRKWYLDEEIGMEEGEEAKILIFKEGTILAYDFKDEDFYNNLSTTKLRINEIDIYAAIPVEWVLKHKKAFRRL